MTTARSPVRVLRAQAKEMAATLKAAEQGNVLAPDPEGKIVAARKQESVTFAVVMDDKVLKIEMAWSLIRDTSRAGIAEYILKQMRNDREIVH